MVFWIISIVPLINAALFAALFFRPYKVDHAAWRARLLGWATNDRV